MMILRRLFAPPAVRELLLERDRLQAALLRSEGDGKALASELAEARHTAARISVELAEAQSGLRVAQFENRQLWKLNARNTSRIESEDAIFLRSRAEAESARLTSSTPAEEAEEIFSD